MSNLWLEEESVKKLLAVRMWSEGWMYNSSRPHELQHWLTTTSINISFAIGSKLEQQSTEPENTNPKAEHTRNKPAAGGWLGVRNPDFHWGGRTCSHHFCFITSSLPALSHLSPGSSHPTLRQGWLCAFAMDFEEMQNYSTKALCSNFGSRHLQRIEYHCLHLPDKETFETMTFETEMIKNHQEFKSFPSL